MRPALCALLALALNAGAQASEPLTLTAQGQVQVAFTPGDDAGALVADVVNKAKRQVLVQIYSFTHKDIAQALIAARGRGVDVQMIADPEQAERTETSLVEEIARSGVPVYLDNQHAAAHNKVMVIDAGSPNATVITGSFNFTHAAQYRNAENLLILRGNPLLADAYAANWRRHRTHSLPFRP